MKCPKCKTPQNGYGGWCRACGHAGGNVRRAMLWTLIPTSMIAALLLARIGYAEITRQGSSRNSYSNAIETQNASGRSAAFAKLMHDAGQTCSRTSKSLFRGDIGPNAAWALRCEDSGDWLVLIASNGATRIASCGPLNKAGTPCWTQL
ncbi:hypothetical protein [Sphingobium xenophagum]|uniref:hypothetical protein n=1 Tax=Sphingobium xenophagum TaxID=121428 RepID=UPI0003A781C3|nr:hypothetical protein [Sphingobium xenophagum]|tara:strand:+ start:3014 stop:3460 length:447 start_codon:yes stop_codon:yes gene_type:complete